jgi:hypothetical protein
MSPEEPETGDLHGVETRSVQRMGGGTSALGVNLSKTGATVLGVEPQDDLELVVFEKGIWIPKHE